MGVKNPFAQSKAAVLSKLRDAIDKSPKGTLDAPIVDLIHYINHQDDYVTTSSCSGRISLYAVSSSRSQRGDNAADGHTLSPTTSEGTLPPQIDCLEERTTEDVSYKGRGYWALVEHRRVEYFELEAAIQTAFDDKEKVANILLLKFEPLILHVQCKDMECAQALWRIAVGCGFRESGVVPGRKIMVHIRTTSGSLEVPIMLHGKRLVNKENTQLLCSHANERFENNYTKTQTFFNALRQHFDSSRVESGLSSDKISYQVSHKELSSDAADDQGIVMRACDRWGCSLSNMRTSSTKIVPVLFGGYGGGLHHSRRNDVLVYDDAHGSDTWKTSRCISTELPCPRVRHTQCSLGKERNISIIIGGRASPARPLSDIFCLNVVGQTNFEHSWQQIQPLPTTLSFPARWAHSAIDVSLNSEFDVIVFGGRDATCCYSDVISLKFSKDFTQYKSIQQTCSGALPSARFGHATALCGNHSMLIHGGYAAIHERLQSVSDKTPSNKDHIQSDSSLQGRLLGDFHVLDLQTWTWSTPMLNGVLPSPRCSHVLLPIPNLLDSKETNSKFLILGGSVANAQEMSASIVDLTSKSCCSLDPDLFKYTSDTTSWKTKSATLTYFIRGSACVLPGPDSDRNCKILCVGGGGLTFSFGAYYAKPHILTLSCMPEIFSKQNLLDTTQTVNLSSHQIGVSPEDVLGVLVPAQAGAQVKQALSQLNLFDLSARISRADKDVIHSTRMIYRENGTELDDVLRRIAVAARKTIPAELQQNSTLNNGSSDVKDKTLRKRTNKFKKSMKNGNDTLSTELDVSKLLLLPMTLAQCTRLTEKRNSTTLTNSMASSESITSWDTFCQLVVSTVPMAYSSIGTASNISLNNVTAATNSLAINNVTSGTNSLATTPQSFCNHNDTEKQTTQLVLMIPKKGAQILLRALSSTIPNFDPKARIIPTLSSSRIEYLQTILHDTQTNEKLRHLLGDIVANWSSKDVSRLECHKNDMSIVNETCLTEKEKKAYMRQSRSAQLLRQTELATKDFAELHIKQCTIEQLDACIEQWQLKQNDIPQVQHFIAFVNFLQEHKLVTYQTDTIRTLPQLREVKVAKLSENKLQKPRKYSRQVQTVRDTLTKFIETHRLTYELIDDMPHKLEMFGGVLLLPQKSMRRPEWLLITTQSSENTNSSGTSQVPEVWEVIAKATNVDRIARRDEIAATQTRDSRIKLLRGSNGWVEIHENGVKYHLDITRVMFSTGNDTEKYRVGTFHCEGQTVLDMYAGIGYFTIPYAVHAKASKIYACDINPAAIECLRKNVVANHVQDKVTILHQDNQLLATQLANTVDRINLGYLPTSEPSWPIAVQCLRDRGGYLHIHANISRTEASITKWGHQVAEKIASLAHMYNRPFMSHVCCLHVEIVKSYAPKIVHCVADIECGNLTTSHIHPTIASVLSLVQENKCDHSKYVEKASLDHPSVQQKTMESKTFEQLHLGKPCAEVQANDVGCGPFPFTDTVSDHVSIEDPERKFWCHKQPFALRNFIQKETLRHFTPEALKKHVQGVIQSDVSVHTSHDTVLSFVPSKNFSFKVMPFVDFIEQVQTITSSNVKKSHPSQTEIDEKTTQHSNLHEAKDKPNVEYQTMYLRAVGSNPRRDRADFWKDFPSIAYHLPMEQLIQIVPNQSIFSSVLRIGTGNMTLWTHFDVMDNILIQLHGRKRVLLFPPEVAHMLYLQGSSSPIRNWAAFCPTHEAYSEELCNMYPLCREAIRHAVEVVLEPGDALFLPALWCHGVSCESSSASVGLNIFWRDTNIDPMLFSSKDLYGNRAPLCVDKAASVIDDVGEKMLQDLPAKYRIFYLRYLASQLVQASATVVPKL